MASRPSTSAPLTSIRHDLEEIDRAIVLLVAARLDAAGEAIRLRMAQGDPLENPSQEKRVIERARAWALRMDLSPVLAETILRAMMEAGKERYVARARSLNALARRPAPRRNDARGPAHRPSPVVAVANVMTSD